MLRPAHLRSRRPLFTAWGDTPWWLAHPALLLGLALCWVAVQQAGGSRSALPHLFYLVVIAAATRFDRLGGAVYGVLAGVVSGPLLLLDVATGTPQPPVNWITRGAFFVVAGVVVGSALRGVQRGYLDQLTSQLRHELAPVGQPTPGADRDAARQRILEVIDRSAFHVVYQPMYSLSDGRLLAVEALTRFEAEPARSPVEWFTEAAGVGLGTELELAVLTAAFDGSRELPEEVALSINCSPAALADPRFLRSLGTWCSRPVIVELTEHATVEDYQPLGAAIRSLREHGARLAIDDAGAGFSSLRHIVRLTPEIIKLDISLTQGLHDDPVRRALADALLRFAQETGSLLVAEGIEHPADLATWVDLGADAAQGYHLGRPGPLPAPARSPQVTPHLTDVVGHPGSGAA
jgi:EAL domain-containing protein (putative c-di-GMP-specific phosphodiesterase class I)